MQHLKCKELFPTPGPLLVTKSGPGSNRFWQRKVVRPNQFLRDTPRPYALASQASTKGILGLKWVRTKSEAIIFLTFVKDSTHSYHLIFFCNSRCSGASVFARSGRKR